MFRIQPRADGRSKIADDGLGDAVETKRNSRATQTILRQTDGHAEKKPRRRVAPAQTKINRNQKRKIKNPHLREIDRHECLQKENNNQRKQNRARTKLVYFNVRFRAANVEGIVHRVPTGDGAVETLAGGSGLASFFNSNGCSVSRTITSSRRSRLAEGLTRICLNGLPGLISATVPTGRSRGKIRSMPLVTTRSPAFTVSSLATYFMVSSGSPVPPTGL